MCHRLSHCSEKYEKKKKEKKFTGLEKYVFFQYADHDASKSKSSRGALAIH